MTLSPLFVQSLEKGMRVLESFDSVEQFHGLADIAALSGLDKSAAQRFTFTLEKLGYLEKCPKTKRFSLGKKTLGLAFNYLRSNPLVEAATPALVELKRHCGEHVSLSLFDDTTIIYAIRQQSKREYHYSSLIGRRMPTFCSAGGRAVLSRLPRDRMMDIIARSDLTPMTGKSITDPEKIYAKVDEARETGYAVILDECMLGEIALAVAVLGSNGMPVAAIHIAGSNSEWDRAEFERRFAPLAIETAQSVSRKDIQQAQPVYASRG
jgi:DNA-binding IclR family transcriptional regulator